MIQVLLAGLILFSNLALAEEDPGPMFGPEFTFTPVKGKPSKKAIYKVMKKHLIQGQKAGAKFREETVLEVSEDVELAYSEEAAERRSKRLLHSPNGWWVSLSPDQGVIEAQMKPLTVDEFGSYKEDIQDALFVSAANAGHFPALFGGGGHINMDFNYFLDKPLLLRNFLADLLNHNELFLGIWNFDSHNAVSWNLMGERYWEKLLKEFQLFDERLKQSNFELSFQMGSLKLVLMEAKDPYMIPWHLHNRQRSFAVNLHNAYLNLTDEARIEIRGFRPQASADVFYRQIRLIRNRLRYLAQFDDPIPIRPIVKTHHLEFVRATKYLEPPIDRDDALAAFQQYVEESGEILEDHLDYIWPAWQNTDGENDCNDLLKP